MHRFSSLRSDEGGVTKRPAKRGVPQGAALTRRVTRKRVPQGPPAGDLVQLAEEPQGKKVGGDSGRAAAWMMLHFAQMKVGGTER